MALIGFSILQQHKLDKLSQNTNPESAAVDESSGDGVSDMTLQKHSDQSKTLESVSEPRNILDSGNLQTQLTATEQALDTAHKQFADAMSREAEIKRIDKELQSQYLEDTDAKNSFKKSFKDSLDSALGELFLEMNLSPENLEEFKNLLTDQQSANYEIYIEALKASSSDE